MKKLILPVIVFVFLLLAASSSVYAVPETTNPSQKSTSSYNPYCWDTHMGDEMLVCGWVSTKCLQSCTPLASGPREACFKKCNDESTACRKKASAAYKVCIEAEKQAKKQQKQNTPSPSAGINNSTEKPQVGVSSKDFKALARAQAELQKAQAELEEIKKANDPRWEEKKDFSAEYNAAFKGDEKQKEDFKAFRGDLETLHELVSKYKDFSEIEETVESIKKGEIGDYGKMDFFTDAVKSFNDYHDLRSSGVSVKDATTKSTLDNFGSSALTLIPVLKAIDLVATTPDFIFGIFGVSEDNWSRKYVTDGFIGKFAPSGVVEQTTDLMIEDDWADIGNALKYGWNRVVEAEGWADTITEFEKLTAATIGAVPVAIAQGVSDIVGGGMAAAEGALDLIGSWFTYPD